jgi:hypothetical protein
MLREYWALVSPLGIFRTQTRVLGPTPCYQEPRALLSISPTALGATSPPPRCANARLQAEAWIALIDLPQPPLPPPLPHPLRRCSSPSRVSASRSTSSSRCSPVCCSSSSSAARPAPPTRAQLAHSGGSALAAPDGRLTRPGLSGSWRATQPRGRPPTQPHTRCSTGLPMIPSGQQAKVQMRRVYNDD